MRACIRIRFVRAHIRTCMHVVSVYTVRTRVLSVQYTHSLYTQIHTMYRDTLMSAIYLHLPIHPSIFV
jgi:hypothetical protein